MLRLRPTKLRPVVSAARSIASNVPDLPPNEPLTDFTNPDVAARLHEAVDGVSSRCEDIPIVIGGQEYRTDNVG